MTDPERSAIAAVCVMAALADGSQSAEEREQVRTILDGIGLPELGTVPARVARGEVTAASAAAALGSPALRELAWEMAVCVTNADGVTSDAERRFLDGLRTTLGLEASTADAVRTRGETLAAAAAAPAGGPSGDVEQTIRSAAVLTGALELLPQGLASLAIIPLQAQLVYRIAQRHGVQLDQTAARELVATVGIGLTGQMFESVARRIVGAIGRAVGGGLVGGLTTTATGAALTFATTYALGQVAESYYAGGRTLDTTHLRDLFQRKLGEAKALYERYAAEVQSRASTLDPGKLIDLVRGG